MIRTVLIANRGEIACRIIRTARRLGLRTVAVYSDADAQAQHVAQADAAHRIGPAPARDSYLKIDAILEAARRSGADAVHPGYGFLSENADFAEACGAAGLTFIGPPPAAIRAMGSKSAAKALMARAGVPLVPGYHGTDQDPATLAKAAAEIGYPVLVKASAGGGGRGMRIVDAPAKLADALAGARREAEAAFGDPQLLIEKYLTQPRHIEMQVFADRQGNCIHLFERDCSIQRRYQKVVEEAPAPGMTAARRAAMGAAAIAAARAVGYVGAGTVEFIAPGDAVDAFYFMEMNTRLQVEHPVTEAITGLDLVEWQIRVADGEPLPLDQDAVRARGHAIEVRLYAEDPRRDFLPQPGRLEHVWFPEGAGVRVDTGVRSGDVVPHAYDPMIAKLIAWGETRAAAIARLERALAETEVAGVRTNLALLAAVIGHPAFAAGAVDTGFIARHRAELLPDVRPADARSLALATLAVLLAAGRDAQASARGTADPHSPWTRAAGWRLNRDAWQECRWRDGKTVVAVRAQFAAHGLTLTLPGAAAPTLAADGALADDGTVRATLDGVVVTARVVRHGDVVTVFDGGNERSLTVVDPLATAAAGEAAVGKLTAPMPGRIAAVRVAPGERVKRGHPLVVVEAMKMEHTVAAPAAGVVVAVHYRVGDLVEEGAVLLVLEAEGGAR